MPQDMMHYDKLVEEGLRSVVRRALAQTAEEGLPGAHHFYIGFATQAPGVDIPEYLKLKFPHEMTIVLQHRFWGLEVNEDNFEVSLTFNKRQERLHIPFAAITSFVDPSVQFGLQFRPEGVDLPVEDEDDDDLPELDNEQDDAAAEADGDQAEEATGEGEAGDNVVTLDSFRRK